MTTPSWSTVLEQIQTTLDASLSAAERRSAALTAIAEPWPILSKDWSQGLEEALHKQQTLRELAAKATAPVAAADAALAGEEEALRQWLRSATSARTALAELLRRSIG